MGAPQKYKADWLEISSDCIYVTWGGFYEKNISESGSGTDPFEKTLYVIWFTWNLTRSSS